MPIETEVEILSSALERLREHAGAILKSLKTGGALEGEAGEALSAYGLAFRGQAGDWYLEPPLREVAQLVLTRSRQRRPPSPEVLRDLERVFDLYLQNPDALGEREVSETLWTLYNDIPGWLAHYRYRMDLLFRQETWPPQEVKAVGAIPETIRARMEEAVALLERIRRELKRLPGAQGSRLVGQVQVMLFLFPLWKQKLHTLREQMGIHLSGRLRARRPFHDFLRRLRAGEDPPFAPLGLRLGLWPDPEASPPKPLFLTPPRPKAPPTPPGQEVYPPQPPPPPPEEALFEAWRSQGGSLLGFLGGDREGFFRVFSHALAVGGGDLPEGVWPVMEGEVIRDLQSRPEGPGGHGQGGGEAPTPQASAETPGPGV